MKILTSLLVTVALVTTTVGCGSRAGAVVKSDLIDCGRQDLGQTVADAGVSLLMTVATILIQGGTDWRHDLDSLGGTYGSDAVSCAVKIASDLFKTATTPGSGSGSGSSTPTTAADAFAEPYVRAGTYNQGKSFK